MLFLHYSSRIKSPSSSLLNFDCTSGAFRWLAVLPLFHFNKLPLFGLALISLLELEANWIRTLSARLFTSWAPSLVFKLMLGLPITNFSIQSWRTGTLLSSQTKSFGHQTIFLSPYPTESSTKWQTQSFGFHLGQSLTKQATKPGEVRHSTCNVWLCIILSSLNLLLYNLSPWLFCWIKIFLYKLFFNKLKMPPQFIFAIIYPFQDNPKIGRQWLFLKRRGIIIFFPSMTKRLVFWLYMKTTWIPRKWERQKELPQGLYTKNDFEGG